MYLLLIITFLSFVAIIPISIYAKSTRIASSQDVLLLLQEKGKISIWWPQLSSRCVPCTGISGLRKKTYHSSMWLTLPASGRRPAVMEETRLAFSGLKTKIV